LPARRPGEDGESLPLTLSTNGQEIPDAQHPREATMRSANLLLAASVILTAAPAHAQPYQLTYTGKALSGVKGYLAVPGATSLQIVYTVSSLPAAKKCTTGNITALPKSYSDGSNTMTGLISSGYLITTNFSFCMGKTGTKVSSWSFALTSYDSQSRLPYYSYDAKTSHVVGTKTPDSVTWDAAAGDYKDAGASGVWRLKTLK
jgi:hypothetical protein